MFFKKTFNHTIHISPQMITANVEMLVKQYLATNIEGKCTIYGHTVCVTNINSISEGYILMNGYIKFVVEYDAVVLNPVKNEVLEAPIVSTNKMGYFAAVGPLSVFISIHQIPQNVLNNIKVNDMVRLRIIGTKADNMNVVAIGTLNEDYLGLVY
ncbi:transcription initiation factor TFIID subunit TAF5 [Ecytonucleospora hepatopenaei]|uniref:Transcription initiation factor TFIID subunit TAF5 n=1 Tax=Ecytonucleospora hepatopenaei TaxID=646526 RepID=A0A1W0E7Y2_9MICR|nr:transcription initiation factor TFIID subunit TAF5 [Ecytonucleospora hepatopenaei]